MNARDFAFRFGSLGTPVPAPPASAPATAEVVRPDGDDVRVTLSGVDAVTVQALAERLVGALGVAETQRSKVQPNASGRMAMTLGFSAASLGLPAAGPRSGDGSGGSGRGASPAVASRRDYERTDEQKAIREAFEALAKGDSLTIRAYAGTGKTSVLRDCAETEPASRFLYLAFNKTIAAEASKSFPRNVEVRTAHALAMRQIRQMGRDDVGTNPRADDVAAVLGLPARLGTITQRTAARFVLDAIERFCQTDAERIEFAHVPDSSKIRSAGLEERIRAYARHAWKAMVDGGLPLGHSAYLKLWQLMLASGKAPKLRYDVVLFDEAQDANPVIASIVQNLDARLVRVGDSFQQIYGWRGAVDALDTKRGRQLYMTRSFRFGEHVAGAANNVLKMHPSERARTAPPLVGAGKDDPVRLFGDAQAVLCRTNGGLFEETVTTAEADRTVSILGGIEELRELVSGAVDLYGGRSVLNGPFSHFQTWEEAKEEVENGLARDVAFVVKRVDQRGIASLQNDLALIQRRHVDERTASVVFSTIHKAKGREWDSVRLSGDMSSCDEIRSSIDKAESLGALRQVGEEVNLIYVAVTRARRQLILPLGLAPLQQPGFRFEPSRRHP